jgi:1-deoxy-D-xylulose-5-phosphate reductoisomerase
MELCRRALRQGGGYPAAANAANEVANAAFRQGRISMPRIAECIEAALDRPLPNMVTEQDVLAIDAECRRLTEQMI